MNEYLVKDVDTGDVWHKDTKEEAEEAVEEFGDVKNLEIIEPDDSKATADSTDDSSPETTMDTQQTETTETRTAKPVESNGGSVEDYKDVPMAKRSGMEDPLETLPGWMKTEIQHGKDTAVDLNKRGSQVIANALNLQVTAECEVAATDTDHEYSRYRATVETPEGQTYNAVGDASVKESNVSEWDLERMAETRAKKRAVKWATGGGLEAFLQGEQ